MSFVRVCAVAAAIAAVAASASGSQVSVTGTLHPTIALAGERVALSATVVGYAAAVVTVQWTPTNATRSPVLVSGKHYTVSHTFRSTGTYPIAVSVEPAASSASGPAAPSVEFGPLDVKVQTMPRKPKNWIDSYTFGIGPEMPKFVSPRTVLMEPLAMSALLAAMRNYVGVRYLEFGGGGSSVLASTVPTLDSVVTVESDEPFLNSLLEQPALNLSYAAGRWTPIPVNIGSTKSIGYPANNLHRSWWPRYAAGASQYGPQSFDVILVDGRFRVACALEALRLLAPGGVVLMHDYSPRPHYHVVTKWYTEEAVIQELAVLRPIHGAPLPTMKEVMKYAFDPR